MGPDRDSVSPQTGSDEALHSVTRTFHEEPEPGLSIGLSRSAVVKSGRAVGDGLKQEDLEGNDEEDNDHGNDDGYPPTVAFRTLPRVSIVLYNVLVCTGVMLLHARAGGGHIRVRSV